MGTQPRSPRTATIGENKWVDQLKKHIWEIQVRQASKL